MGMLKSVKILGGPYLLTELSSLKIYSAFEKKKLLQSLLKKWRMELQVTLIVMK